MSARARLVASADPTELPSGESEFQKHVLTWYATHRRVLPWRGDCDPYRVFVSEVMLQQTSVARVIPIYLTFCERFPDVRSVGEATTANVLRAWSGLGYNRRALNLKRAAQTMCTEFGEELPGTIAQLERLPGVGPYTARAVACFAFGEQVAVVDTNIRRVLSGFVGHELRGQAAQQMANRLLPNGRAAEWNQALMDYGALVYRAKPKRSTSHTPKFETTNRFWRGRIISALRLDPVLSLPSLLTVLTYEGKEEERVRGLVRILHEEGLVAYDACHDEVSLPV
jgi:A/G-specific adenine glycosylase